MHLNLWKNASWKHTLAGKLRLTLQCRCISLWLRFGMMEHTRWQIKMVKLRGGQRRLNVEFCCLCCDFRCFAWNCDENLRLFSPLFLFVIVIVDAFVCSFTIIFLSLFASSWIKSTVIYKACSIAPFACWTKVWSRFWFLMANHRHWNQARWVTMNLLLFCCCIESLWKSL